MQDRTARSDEAGALTLGPLLAGSQAGRQGARRSRNRDANVLRGQRKTLAGFHESAENVNTRIHGLFRDFEFLR